MTEFFGKKYHGYVDVYDNPEYKMKLEPIYHHNIKESFIFDDLQEKLQLILSLLDEKIIDKNKKYCRLK